MARERPRGAAPFSFDAAHQRERLMGKYFLAWLLGIPAGLLLLIYVFTRLF